MESKVLTRTVIHFFTKEMKQIVSHNILIRKEYPNIVILIVEGLGRDLQDQALNILDLHHFWIRVAKKAFIGKMP